jgi:hypothetical protein
VNPDLFDVLDFDAPFPECGEKSLGDAGSILAVHGHQMRESGRHADLTVLAPVRLLQPLPGFRAR